MVMHNLNIPGWNDIYILDVLAQKAAEVPENGFIVELGALFGRSTYTLGNSKKPSVRLCTIDIWPDVYLANHVITNFHDDKAGPVETAMLTSAIVDNKYLPGAEFHRLWKHFSGDFVNGDSIRDRTTLNNSAFPMADFIFHDADHSFSGVYADLNHWLPKLKPHGIIVVDDYEPIQFSGVCMAVDKFVERHSLKTEMVTSRNILIHR
jgi:predicted O-methyltransferase YrrM